MKGFSSIKAMYTDSEVFQYFKQQFPRISEAELKQNKFVGHKSKVLIRDNAFDLALNDS